MTANKNKTTDAVVVPQVETSSKPVFLRLPQAGQRCPYTGMSRSGLNSLILPGPLNAGRPPVRSFVLRQKGARHGVRLIDYESLAAYIRQHEQQPATV